MYEIDKIPLGGIRPGTTILVAGPRHAGARNLGLRMLSGRTGEGVILITTNQRAARIADECSRIGVQVASDRTAIIDCVGDQASDLPARILPVSSPSDLTGIGMRYSDVYSEFKMADISKVRTGLFSISTLLSFSDLKTVSRFVHTLVGRIDSVDGLGMVLMDPENHDARTVSTISQFCGGRIDVRETEESLEFRASGLERPPREWISFETL